MKLSQFGNIYLWKNLFSNAHLEHYCVSSSMMEYLIIKRALCMVRHTKRYSLCFEIVTNNRYSSGEMSYPSVFATEIFAVFLLRGNHHRQVFVLCLCWMLKKNSVRKKALDRAAVHTAGAELWNNRRSVTGIFFILFYFIFIGFPFQTWFIRRMEVHIRCRKVALYFLATLLSWEGSLPGQS